MVTGVTQFFTPRDCPVQLQNGTFITPRFLAPRGGTPSCCGNPNCFHTFLNAHRHHASSEPLMSAPPLPHGPLGGVRVEPCAHTQALGLGGDCHSLVCTVSTPSSADQTHTVASTAKMET